MKNLNHQVMKKNCVELPYYSPSRFTENTKIIVVDGAHGIGKTKFAKELAEDLDMKYFPEPHMDQMYISPSGEDWRYVLGGDIVDVGGDHVSNASL